MKRPTLAEQIAGRCVHFNGTMNRRCRAGMVYDEVDRNRRVPYRAALPCHTPDVFAHHYSGPQCHCPHVRFPTAEEVRMKEQEHERHMAKMVLALGIVAPLRKEHAGKYWVGEVVCPVCGGVLHVRHHGNGHVHARCETKGCVAWME